MKIKFLGTSAGWPLPRLGCTDEICSSKDPRDTRTRSQALINDILLLDAGPDTYEHLRRTDIDPTKIRAAAITHEHSDHTFGLWDLSHIYTETGRLKPKIFIHPKTLAKIRFMFFPNEYEIVKVETVKALENLETTFENLTLTFLPVEHTNSTFGILVKEGKKKFFWAPDFKSLPKNTAKVVEHADAIAIDGSELKVQTRGHETIMEGLELGKRLNAKSIYFIHLGHRTLPHKKLEKLIKKVGGENFNIAYDSLEIII
ncbi:MAG: hypothetical protein A2172_04415 [Candidatus Woykebacteria bacterium RBG_13_40_15]|uniref:Metallo-beta-lactamase domain-containing protein n=1 Tax=Candidatus Woykebacteria bacterium RBG_13_40_15 TaxID=1802593 RepID=A0A1G1W701_9BACT|nr:MAG: hypothetical protein A2172_04415 [Candidatus Woykebacteria bacterium RBG_13_40_15]